MTLTDNIAKLEQISQTAKKDTVIASSNIDEVNALKEQVKELQALSKKQKASGTELEARISTLSTASKDSTRMAKELVEKERELGSFKIKIAELEAIVQASIKAQESGEK